MLPSLDRPSADEYNVFYANYVRLVPNGDIIRTLQSQHADIHALLHGVADKQLSASPAPGEWSAKQVVLHVTDSERMFAFRALWFARGEQTALPGMEPDPWIAATDANTRSIDSLLAEFDHVRAASISLFEHLDAAAWLRHGQASGFPVSVRALAWIIAGHELHHNQSLREKYV